MTLEKAGLFPTAYFSGLIGTGAERDDASQYT
jgi:hypothetical protein